MTSTNRTVLITGCSDGSLGAALAAAFHKAGLHVYATARNLSKMKHLEALGIQTLELDVLSDSSIATCLSRVPQLDILVNNAGANYVMPFSDLSIPEAKKLFDLNVWSYLAVAQAFLPLLLKSKGMIVNQTSVASVLTIPWQSTYDASKAAISMFSDTQRLELAPFGITVVDLKTGSIKSNMNSEKTGNEPSASLPKGSIYEPARETIELALTGGLLAKSAAPSGPWADEVVHNLLKKKPPPNIWTGGYYTWLVRLGLLLPFGMLDGTVKKITGLDIVEKLLQK